jgi:hypothetical protein
MAVGRYGWMALIAIVLAGFEGCGKSRFVPVSGVVTLDGKPLAGAGLQFRPDSSSGQYASAKTGNDGTFTAATGEGKGMAPGTYRVLVTARKLGHGVSVPSQYSSAETTPLRDIKIPADGPLELELQSKGKPKSPPGARRGP